MSFNFDFVATQKDAAAIVESEHAPECVKGFLQMGLLAFKPEDYVHVKAIGHLFDGPGSYDRSSADLCVERGMFRVHVPKEAA
jgi:hypothetical protein